ncbi:MULTISPECIES: helix-turn-helix domain-containing protein [Ferrimicrobium]|uniref:AlbA family DNA-binding domain-containing protein n=1 Tax=Ferrimicrobium TaxID=121038 RepID=UPI0023F1E1BB|nr:MULTISPECIES: ATP-binding protein [Ferrimicrobium]
MTSISTLFSCAVDDVTLERVLDLVNQGEPEGLTLEYKRQRTSKIAESVAAMANTYGGIILVGIADGTDDQRLVGISEQEVTGVASSLHDTLEPPWEPELIPVKMSNEGNRYILVIRVDHTVAPRPILIKGAAPVRLQGRNGVADRSRLRELFADNPAATHFESAMVPPINIRERRPDGSIAYDFVIKTGLVLPLGDAATWRPFSEQHAAALMNALEGPLLEMLPNAWWQHFLPEWKSFEREGFNRSRNVKAVMRFERLGSSVPIVEVIAEAKAPQIYGITSGTLQFTLDIIGRIRECQASDHADQDGGKSWRLQIADLLILLDGLIALMTKGDVTTSLAHLAGIDLLRVGQPRRVYFQTGVPVNELLAFDGLKTIVDSGSSYGTSGLLADPSLDFTDLSDRRQQVERWMNQIALDAGLLGMEQALAQIATFGKKRKNRQLGPNL